jgi:UDP-glucose 4-epimerase
MTGSVFNGGSDDEITIEGLTRKMIVIMGGKNEKEFVRYEIVYGMLIDYMMRYMPCLNKIKGVINGQSKIRLKKILSKVIKQKVQP